MTTVELLLFWVIPSCALLLGAVTLIYLYRHPENICGAILAIVGRR